VDPERFKEAWQRLEVLDDRLGYRVRSRNRPGASSPSMEQLDERVRDLAELTTEIKEVVRELFLALGTKRPSP
jgi:hypothetical protein